MGLGGITRDSIADLQSLVNNAGEREPLRRSTSGDGNLGGSWNKGKNSSEFAFLENSAPPPADEGAGNNNEIARQSSFKEPLNDSPATPAMVGTGHGELLIHQHAHGKPPSPPSLSSSAVAAATTSTPTTTSSANTYKSVSSTNSRSLGKAVKVNCSDVEDGLICDTVLSCVQILTLFLCWITYITRCNLF